MPPKPKFPIEHLPLSPPPLPSILAAIQKHLPSTFLHTTVSISTPPDLRLAPYHLAAAGLSGSTRVVDIGHPSNLHPPNLSKRYDLLEISKLINLPAERGFVLGAGAAPFWVVGANAELAPNLAYERVAGEAAEGDGEVKVFNESHYTRIDPVSGGAVCRKVTTLDSKEDLTGLGIMGNLYGSEGLPGECLHIKAVGRKRDGGMNFTDAIQDAIRKEFGRKEKDGGKEADGGAAQVNDYATDDGGMDRLISLGGVFVIKRGKANLHVMPDFPKDKNELADHDKVFEWLRYFDFDAPLVCCSVLHTGNQQGMDLRSEHTHCFSTEGDGIEGGGRGGGHYHYDVDETRDVVEYEAWYNVAEELWRVDRPGAKAA